MPSRARPRSTRHLAGNHWRRRALCAALSLGAVTAGARAQDRDIERRIEQRARYSGDPRLAEADEGRSFAEKALIDVGGFLSFTYLDLTDDTGNARRLLQYDGTVFARASWDNAHTAFLRSRFRYRDFSPGDSFDDRGDGWYEPFLDRFWYELDLVDHNPDNTDGLSLNLRAGRQFVDWGSGLALSEALYAVRPAISLGSRVTAEALIGITPADKSIIDFDASRSEYNRNTERAYFGGLVRASTEEGKTFYAYYLSQHDRNGFGTPSIDLGIDVDFKYDSHYIGVGSYGSLSPHWLYEAEVVFEGGHSQSDPLRGPQRRETIRALAARGQLTYLFADANQSRLQFETIVASGDKDRLVSTDTLGGNAPGTPDNGFNSLGFANTGLAFAPSLSNLVVMRVGASTLPLYSSAAFNQLQIGADVLVFGKYEENGPIDEPTFGRSFLGVETDVFLNYRITSDLSLGVRYGAFFPGSAIDGDRGVRHFFLVGVTLSF